MKHGFGRLAGAMVAVALVAAMPAGAVSADAGAGEAGAFVAGTEDLPLMAGLRQMPDQGVVFETAQGRIVEVFAVGFLDRARVERFYVDSLPQLGWRHAGGLTFRREGEVLTLSFPQGADPLTVRFRIAPGS